MHPLVEKLGMHPCVIIWRHFHPRVVKERLSGGTFGRNPLETTFEEPRQEGGLDVFESVLLNQDALELPRLQLLDPLQLASPVIKL